MVGVAHTVVCATVGATVEKGLANAQASRTFNADNLIPVVP